MEFWNKKSFCLITGASRGIGREISIQFANNFGEGSTVVLIARSKKGLEETKAKIFENVGNKINVKIYSLDLSKPKNEEYLSLIKEAAGENPTKFELNLLVHNAASVGNLKNKHLDLDNLLEWQDNFTFNVFSMVILTSQFFKVFNDSSKNRMVILLKFLKSAIFLNNFLIQISSIASKMGFPTLTQYSAGKCARNIIIEILNTEEPSIKTMSYSPGPIDTEMYKQLLEEPEDENMRKAFKDILTQGNVTVQTTVGKLVKVLSENKKINGEYVDHSEINL